MKNNIQHIKHTIINGVLLVLLFIIPDNLLAQKNQVTVSGCVTDATGMTLPSTTKPVFISIFHGKSESFVKAVIRKQPGYTPPACVPCRGTWEKRIFLS